MRHGKKFNHLSRKKAHRELMLANMACSLIAHKRIKTTVAKAKALRLYVEPLVTKSKHSITTKTSLEQGTHLRRVVFSYLRDKEAVKELFGIVAPKVVDRNGGYTRIIKTGFRKGDGAEMAIIELVDFNELYTKESAKKKTRRRGAKKAKPAAEVADTAEATKSDEAPANDASENTEVTE